MPFLIVLAILAVVVIYVVVQYNGLVRVRNRIENGWAQIDVQLKRRHDLIPNLVETVKGYAAHERSTLEAVIAARNSALSAKGEGNIAAAENNLSGTLKNLFALGEAYPPQSQPKLPAVARGTDRDRGQNCVLPTVFQ